MKRLFTILTLALFCQSVALNAQAPENWTSTKIFQEIQKAQFLGSVLYVAAHPDDENTRMISFLANEVKAETAYLSLTRGDGGQNLIGTELAEKLGVMRTQELLAARRVDGGQQFFSRAIDFGFSKHPDETLAIWNEEEVMADLVWTVRKFRPDVIINRFDHESAGKTHGHHTSSAVLSYQAWESYADKKMYPKQLAHVDTWQPKRLFFNTSWWFYGGRDKFAKADKSDLMAVDAGVYYPLLGQSNGEIAAISRSQHRCQGMGRDLDRGSATEYLKLLKGDMPTSKTDIFEGVNTTWTRVKGGEGIGELLAQIEKDFDFKQPWKSTPKLVEAYKMLNALPDSHWKNRKLPKIKQLIIASAGLFIEAKANDYSATPGEGVELTMEAISRGQAKVKLNSVQYIPNNVDSTLNLVLDFNQEYEFYKTLSIPQSIPYTTPYWLKKKGELGIYNVENQLLRGLPETPRALKVRWNMEIEGTPISMETDVIYKKSDPVKGEQYRPFEVLPEVFANIQEDVFVFAGDEAKPVNLVVKAGKANVSGMATLNVPRGWSIQPNSIDFNLKLKGEEQSLTFNLTPPSFQSEGTISTRVTVGSKNYSQGITIIEYEHIPTQTVLQETSAKVVKIDLKKKGNKVGYVMGAGDKIPESLEQVGYQVDVLEDGEMKLENLKQYDAIIMGIRAYNTVERMKFYQPILFDYVKQGGTMIVQYNTTWRMPFPSDQLAPYPMKLSRDRVADETAEVRFLASRHPVMNTPNKITKADFENWVQERGLYFPNEWSDDFTAILSANDAGETPKNGSLLVAQYGEGYYIYTGLSMFRELPKGVPGAYRLFTNMISLGK